MSLSKNSVFDKLGGCLKGCRGKECASVGPDKAIRTTSFLKRNIFPFGLSHPLPYARMAAFFDFPNEKIFSFQVEDFRQTAWMSGAAPDRGMLDAWQAEGNNADRRAVLPKKRRCPKRFVCGYGKRRTTQKAKALAPGPTAFFIIQRERIESSRFSFFALGCFCGLRPFLTV